MGVVLLLGIVGCSIGCSVVVVVTVVLLVAGMLGVVWLDGL